MLAQEMPVARRRARTARRALVVLGATLMSALAPSGASAADPSSNIPLGSMPAACWQESTAECQSWLLGRLNAARATLGLPAYKVQANFLSLSADRQIFILADLDRTAYGRSPISGLNAALDEAAAGGVRNETDPLPPSQEGPWLGFGSDWASTGPLLAYYLWMYEDGYPGPNLDCSAPGASGCWGHRHVILGEGLSLPQPQVVGIASGQSALGHAGTALIVSSHSGTSTYYTWTQALAEGAGGGSVPAEEPAPPPPVSCTRVAGRGTINISGLTGTVSDELTTSLTGRQSLETTITYPRVGTIRLTSLASASCRVTSTGREFTGKGSATLNGLSGYAVSFTFTTGATRPTLSLELTRGFSVPLRIRGIPLSSSTELIS